MSCSRNWCWIYEWIGADGMDCFGLIAIFNRKTANQLTKKGRIATTRNCKAHKNYGILLTSVRSHIYQVSVSFPPQNWKQLLTKIQYIKINDWFFRMLLFLLQHTCTEKGESFDKRNKYHNINCKCIPIVSRFKWVNDCE